MSEEVKVLGGRPVAARFKRGVEFGRIGRIPPRQAPSGADLNEGEATNSLSLTKAIEIGQHRLPNIDAESEIRKALSDGRLPNAVRKGPGWLIPENELEALFVGLGG